MRGSPCGHRASARTPRRCRPQRRGSERPRRDAAVGSDTARPVYAARCEKANRASVPAGTCTWHKRRLLGSGTQTHLQELKRREPGGRLILNQNTSKSAEGLIFQGRWEVDLVIYKGVAVSRCFSSSRGGCSPEPCSDTAWCDCPMPTGKLSSALWGCQRPSQTSSFTASTAPYLLSLPTAPCREYFFSTSFLSLKGTKHSLRFLREPPKTTNLTLNKR